MKNLQGLLAFVETVNTGSLTAAAERLDVSPAAVSKNLATLERQLGVRLLNRSTRRLSTTEEGQHFLHRAQTALRLLDEAVADVSQSASTPVGRVRISVGVGFGRQWVLPVLPALTRMYPQLQIDVDLNNTVVNLVAEGCDIGIRGGRLEDSSLIVRRVCDLPVALFASPAYLRLNGSPSTPEQLLQHSCATPRFGHAPPAAWRFKSPDGRSYELTPKPQLTTTDPETLLDLALADVGIVQASLLQALPYLRSGRLKLLMPELHQGVGLEFVLQYPHRLYLAPRVRVVVDALMQHFQESSDLHLSVEDLIKALPSCVVT
ncbi:LysR family transcriptional regulator [Pseudomonas sp. TNT2022 ID357]|uniref:LysR family transcriptional regulator n=1 Tax=Pseudomonas idahonensis TaxID=2942628 RepID=A0ABT5Q3N8_9PSED|nr:LysR family transcriptional regulator [Pseudomonas idahonensis]MDD1148804.1 LysR family transcriptional regulator [Pseudomonas idahonensis]